MKPGNRHNGFTLMELLVVIAIIALLMSILLPSLQRVREQAKRVVCASSLSQIGRLLEFYCGDNSGKYPEPYSGWYHYGGSTYLGVNQGLVALFPYVFNAEGSDAKGSSSVERMNIFWCPSSKFKYDEFTWKSTAFATFGYNQYCGRTSQASEWGGKTRSELEHCPMNNNAKGGWLTFTDICYRGIPGTIGVVSNHNKNGSMKIGASSMELNIPTGGNALHVDTHVEWYKEDYLTNLERNIIITLPRATNLGEWAAWLYPRTP